MLTQARAYKQSLLDVNNTLVYDTLSEGKVTS